MTKKHIKLIAEIMALFLWMYMAFLTFDAFRIVPAIGIILSLSGPAFYFGWSYGRDKT